MFWLRMALTLFALLGAASSQANDRVLRLETQERHALSTYLKVFIESEHSLTIDEIAQLDGQAFDALAGNLSTGFTRAAVWLRFTVERQADDPRQWWLELDQALLEDVRLYEKLPDGRWQERRAGSSLDWRQRELDYRHPVFQLDLPQPGLRTYYLRLASQTAIATRPVLWQPAAFSHAATQLALFNGLYFGVYLFMLIFYLMFWRWTGERLHGAYTLYMGVNLLTAALAAGWLQQFIPPLQSPEGTLVVGLAVAAAAAVAHYFCVQIIDSAAAWPRLTRAYLSLGYGMAAIAALAIVAGHFQLAMQVLQPAMMSMRLALLLAAGVLAWRGSAPARFFLLAFTPFYAGVFVRFLRNQAVLEPSPWTENSYQLGTLVHLLVMSFMLLKGYHRLRMAKEAAEAQTQEERRLREQERDFMGMVSHEFRTPLSIIKATAHNLSVSPGIDGHARERVRKIQRAGLRMAELMDGYLSLERLRSVDQALQVRAYMLDRLCEQVLEELRELPGPCVQFANEAPGALCVCDPELVRLALRNLLQNARRHSPPDQLVSVTLQERAAGYAIRVRDQGPGIPADELPLVFKRYFRGRSALAQPGAGLGLHLAQTAAQRHGGSLTVHSVEGTGAEFCLELPHRPAQTAASAQLGLDPARNVSS